jgi:hypothetical protein
MYYSLFAFGVSLILVILTYKNKLGGLPSYYLKGTTKGAYIIISQNCQKLIWKSAEIRMREWNFLFIRWVLSWRKNLMIFIIFYSPPFSYIFFSCRDFCFYFLLWDHFVNVKSTNVFWNGLKATSYCVRWSYSLSMTTISSHIIWFCLLQMIELSQNNFLFFTIFKLLLLLLLLLSFGNCNHFFHVSCFPLIFFFILSKKLKNFWVFPIQCCQQTLKSSKNRKFWDSNFT